MENRLLKKKIILTFSIVLFFNFSLALVSADWWDSNWLHKQAINLSVPSGSTSQNYQVKLVINSTNNGTNFNWTNECIGGNSSRSRFINGSENTELDFWVESCNVAGQNMTVWVEVDNNITSSGYVIYMYYGNTGADLESNGTATFEFFDDFSGDLSKWDNRDSGDITITSGYLEIAGGGTGSPYGWADLGSNATYEGFVDGIIEGDILLGTNSIAEVSFRGDRAANTGYKSRMDARANQGVSHLKPPYSGWGTIGSASGTACPIGWSTFKITISSTTLRIDACGQTDIETDSDYSSAGEISLQNHYGTSSGFDNVRVRKYASAEPTYSIESEETSGVPIVTLELPQNNYITSDTTVIFNCSSVDNNGLKNITLYTNISGWAPETTIDITGTSNSTTWTNTSIPEGNYIWNCLVYSESSTLDWGNSNYTFTIDTTPPSVTINSPSGTIADHTPTLNITLDETLDTLWYNINNGTNTTICTSCGGEQIEYLLNKEGSYIVYVFANDSAGNVNGTESSSFIVNMSGNYYDAYDDNSSINELEEAVWNLGNVSFTGIEGAALVEGISYEAINDDSDSGISSSKVYTHAIDFGTQTGGGVATINGVVFVDGDGGAFPAIGGGSETIGTGTSTIPLDHGGNNAANAYLNGGSSADMEDLVYDMIYNDATAMIVLTGLTPGQEYQFRLYHRVWGGDRSQNIGFETDGVGSGIAGSEHTGSFDECDATQPDANLGTSTQVNALTYNYTLSAGVTNLTIYIDQTGGGTYHLYGLTNEELPAGAEEAAAGNFTAYAINTTNNITSITNITWTEYGTDTNNNVSVEVSADSGLNWYVATSGSALGQTFTGANNSLIYRVLFATNSSTEISLLDLNISWSETTAEEDTCTAPGSGNWAITCSDNCVWNSDFNVPGNISMSGSGTLTLNANITFTNPHWEIYKEDGCKIVVNSGGSIR